MMHSNPWAAMFSRLPVSLWMLWNLCELGLKCRGHTLQSILAWQPVFWGSRLRRVASAWFARAGSNTDS
jgi:hypothetical protein